MWEKTYLAIDLKSFYASVECVERGLDPLDSNLVVADSSRTEKTICLAVSPSLKAYGISGRARLFEVVQSVKDVNQVRQRNAPKNTFTGQSFLASELKCHPEFSVSYITAPPRMALYMKYSTQIYQTYLKYIAPEDIHIYSIDEVFIDITGYIKTYHLTARELAMKLIKDVLATTGITATAGIGSNLYLCKIAMDIVAKKIPADKDGVRIAELDELSYRKLLWEHRPLTDFWRIGRGYAKKLEATALYTMGDVARFSIKYEDYLYKLFGINAELLIDHAWGYEPCTIKDIKSYHPTTNSISSGQVLQSPYEFEKAKLIVREMTDLLSLDLVEKRVVTSQLVLTICYDIDNLRNSNIANEYKGEITTDGYGRKVPKNAHGTINLTKRTSSSKQLISAAMSLFDRIVDEKLLVRKIYVVANNVVSESCCDEQQPFEQLDFFTDYTALIQKREKEKAAAEREKRRQQAILNIKRKYGKNAIVKGMNMQEGATAISRNGQIGGHRA